RIGDQLVFAARLVQPHAPEHEDPVAVPERDACAPLALAEPAAAHLRRVVLQGEINVPGSGPRQVRDLALDPDPPQTLDQLPTLPAQLGHRQGGPRGARLQHYAHRRIIGAPVVFTGAGRTRKISRLPRRHFPMRNDKEALTFDDVLLQPGYSDVLPREV